MRIDLLHRLSKTFAYCYDVHLVQQKQDTLEDILCVLFSPDLEESSASQDDAASQDVIFFQLFHLQKREVPKTLIYNCYGPPFDPTRFAFVGYDAAQKCWVIAQQQGDWYIGMRTVSEDVTGNLILSPLCLLDRDESDRGFHLLLDLEIINDRYRFLSHKAVRGHLSAPVIAQKDIVLQRPAWSTLEEREVVTQSGAGEDVEITRWQQWREAIQQQPVSAPGQRLLDKILLPEQAFFDPGTINASQAAEVVIVKQAEIAVAENALTIVDRQTRLLVLCSPETWVRPHEHPRSAAAIEQTGEQWRIWLTGWERAELTYKWSYEPDMGLPTDPGRSAYDYPLWPEIEVAAIVGPDTSAHQPTFVATIAMQSTEALLSHGVCLTHAGEVVHVCDAPLGRAPSLCLCQQMVIGVDRLASGWHLWNWLAIDEPNLHSELRLDATCQRAVVRAQPEADRFWLIEEVPDGIRVSQRDVQTLHELEPAELIADAKFLDGPADRPLEPQHHVGLLLYDETLLLLLAGKQEELLLYQAR